MKIDKSFDASKTCCEGTENFKITHSLPDSLSDRMRTALE